MKHQSSIRKLQPILVIFFLFLPTMAHAGELPNPLQARNLPELILTISRTLIGLVAIGATFMFIYGGITMILSAGNVDQVRRGKDVLKWTTIGLVIIFLTGAIIRFIYTVLNRSS